MDVRLFVRQFVLWFAIVAILEWIGMIWDLSAKGISYDKLLHFLGGVTAGYAGVVLVASLGPSCPENMLYWMHQPPYLEHLTKTMMIAAIVFAFVIGVAWEVLQYLWPWLRDYSDQSWQDTLGDVVCDTLGGGAAGFHAMLWMAERKAEQCEYGK